MIPVVPDSCSSAGLVYYSDPLPSQHVRPSVSPSSSGVSTSSSSSSTTGSSSSSCSSSSFTQTFLRGILASIDSKDPVVAHAWLETLLDAIELLPEEVVRREVVPIAISKAQIGEAVFGRQASCRLLGRLAVKLDGPSARSHVLPSVLSLGQDGEPEVRLYLCRHLPLVAKGVGLEATKDAILPQIVELSVDESPGVRLAALDTVLHLLPFLDDSSKASVIAPLVIKVSERARAAEENPFLPNLAHVFGRLLHGLQAHFHPEQQNWGLDFYKSLCKSGLGPSSSSPAVLGSKAMPDIVPVSEDKMLMHARVRKECALNLPAMTALIGAEHFDDHLFQTFGDLVKDANPAVRGAVAKSIQELASLLGSRFATLESQLCTLFADGSILTLEAMVRNMVEIVDILARYGSKRGSSPINFSGEISSALLHCEGVISKTRNWRLHADCLEKFSCLANCISPTTILNKFVPTLFERIHTTRTLPCKVAASRTLLVFLRFTVRSEDRKFILFRMKEELSRGKSCSSRMLFLRVGEMAMSLFSKAYFKLHFFSDMIRLHTDPIPNVRLKLCSLLPKLKALLSLPSDGELLLALEDAVKKLLLVERDRDVLYTLQTVIQELDGTETGMDGLSSGNPEDELDNERKLREERLISNMEEQIIKMHTEIINDDSRFYSPNNVSFRRRSGSLSRDILLSPREELQKSPPRFSDTLSHHQILIGGHHSPINNHESKGPFYSASLENLDPSAKEFLVDAGITLDIRKNESMPNLSQIKDEEAYPKFHINNPPFENPPVRRAETPIVTETVVTPRVEDVRSSPESSPRPKSSPKTTSSLESKLRPPSKLKPPSGPISSSSSSLIDMSSSVSAIAQNTLSRIPYSKLVSSTDRIQGSIERLAEKWESKRRNLSSNNNNSNNSHSESSDDNSNSSKSKSLIVESPKTSSSSMIPSKRNSLLLANKQKMRLSLTDVTSKSSSNSTQKQRKKSPEVPPPKIILDKGKQDNNLEIVEEDMVTYVPPLSTSTSTIISQKAKLVNATNLIVKPLNSTTMASSSNNTITNTTSSIQRSLPVPSLKYNGGLSYKRATYIQPQTTSRPKAIAPPKNNSYSSNTNGTSNPNTTTYVPKFSRVPPPKYRNPPTTNVNRRPLSQQETSPSIRAYNQLGMPGLRRPTLPTSNAQGKSLSAECILDRTEVSYPGESGQFPSPPPAARTPSSCTVSYCNTTPRLKKNERFRYGSSYIQQQQQRRQEESRSPSPNNMQSNRLKIPPPESQPHRYSDVPRRSTINNCNNISNNIVLNNRRRSAGQYPLNNGSKPSHQFWSSKTIPSARSLPSTSSVVASPAASKTKQGLPAPGFSRLPVGSSSYTSGGLK